MQPGSGSGRERQERQQQRVGQRQWQRGEQEQAKWLQLGRPYSGSSARMDHAAATPTADHAAAAGSARRV